MTSPTEQRTHTVTEPAKTRRLRKGLLWAFGGVQAAFAAWIGYIYILTESKMTGEPFNDLGVAIGRDLAIQIWVNRWIAVTLVTAFVFAATYYILKSRWSDRR